MLNLDYLFNLKPVSTRQTNLSRDLYKIIFSYLKPKELALSRLVCREWNAYLIDVDFRREAQVTESPQSFCFFNLSRIPCYRRLRKDFDAAVQKRRAWNLVVQPETLGYLAGIGMMIFFHKAYKGMKAEMYAPSMDELRNKLAYFIGPNATNERILSYLNGETWALRLMTLGFPGLFCSSLVLASAGSVANKDKEETKSAEFSVTENMKEHLLLHERYSQVEELNPYIDPETKRVMHIPVQLKDGKLRDLVTLVNLPNSEFKDYWLKRGYDKVVFRKDIYDLIQTRIKQG